MLAPRSPGVPWLALLLPVVICGILGFAVGVGIFRLGDPELYAPLVTLGIGVIAGALFLSISPFGGSNGLSGIPHFVRNAAGSAGITNYAFNVVFVALVMIAYASFRLSRLALRWRASGDDPIRLEALGSRITVNRAKGFAVSAALAGLAGALYAGTAGFISADLAGVTFSVQALVWVAVGGTARLFGPLLGVLIVESGQQVLSNQFAEIWPLILGVSLLIVVLAAPEGIIGSATHLWSRMKRMTAK